MEWIPSASGGSSSFPDYTQGTAPASPSSGEFWWDTSTHVLKRYDGSAWQWVGLDDLANVDTTGKADTSILEWDTDVDPDAWVDTAKPSGGGGSGGAIVDYAEAKRTSGNITVSNNTDPDTLDSGLDLTLGATAGDLVLVGVSALWNDSGGNWTAMDACTMVSGAKTNYVSTASSSANGLGEMAWFGSPGDLMHVGGQVPYTVVSGDITSGQITLRLLARNNGVNRVLRGGSGDPVKFWATNLGQ